LKKELQLEESILKDIHTAKERAEEAQKEKGGETLRVLLTGSTGFLGAFLLRDLIALGRRGKLGEDKETQRVIIYCTVRGCRDKKEAWRRIEANMQHYLLWPPTIEDSQSNTTSSHQGRKPPCSSDEEVEGEGDSVDVRVKPLRADLSRYKFGVSERVWKRLTEKIDVIYHAATHVNGIFPYAALKASNVTATVEILRLASQAKLKKVNHISTLSVWACWPGATADEDVPLMPHLGFHMMGGYRFALPDNPLTLLD